jgi:hypothetical protein
LIKAGAVYGTSFEHRIYLSGTEERVWETRRFIKGPGYTLESLAAGRLHCRPQSRFGAKSPASDGDSASYFLRDRRTTQILSSEKRCVDAGFARFGADTCARQHRRGLIFATSALMSAT